MHSKRTHSPPCDKKLNLFGKSFQQQRSSHFRTYINSFINLAREVGNVLSTKYLAREVGNVLSTKYLARVSAFLGMF